MEQMNQAMANRSLRTVRSELEFLAETSIISPEQFSSILSQLPSDASAVTQTTSPPAPAQQLQQVTLNEKQNHPSAFVKAAVPPTPSPGPPPPPAYMPPPVLTYASALYVYNPTDAGDLALIPSDRIAVLEYLNPEWWKGRNERTCLEGIFPRNYVRVLDEKTAAPMPPPPSVPMTGYGNMPMEVSQGGPAVANPAAPSKFEQQGKRFGKKLGDATIFGAGATIGSKIVTGIF